MMEDVVLIEGGPGRPDCRGPGKVELATDVGC